MRLMLHTVIARCHGCHSVIFTRRGVRSPCVNTPTALLEAVKAHRAGPDGCHGPVTIALKAERGLWFVPDNRGLGSVEACLIDHGPALNR